MASSSGAIGPEKSSIATASLRGMLLEAVGFLWTMPNTLIGLVLGALTFQAPRIHGGALVFDRRPRGLTSVLRAMNRTAMTVGFVIVSAAPVEGPLLAHERHHIRQSMAWGPLFIPVYLALAIPFGYRRHPMERSARRAAEGANSD